MYVCVVCVRVWCVCSVCVCVSKGVCEYVCVWCLGVCVCSVCVCVSVCECVCMCVRVCVGVCVCVVCVYVLPRGDLGTLSQ